MEKESVSKTRDRSPLGNRRLRLEVGLKSWQSNKHRSHSKNYRHKHSVSAPDSYPWSSQKDNEQEVTKTDVSRDDGRCSTSQRWLPFEHYNADLECTSSQYAEDEDPFTSDTIQFRSFKETTKMFERSLDELQGSQEEEEDEALPRQRMELFCEVCKVGVSSMQALQDHFAGARHQKELRKSGLSSDFTEIGRDKYVEQDPSLKTKVLSCKLCDIVFSGSDMHVHVNNPAHIAALNDFEQPPAKDDPFWFVEVGRTPLTKEKQPDKTADGYHCGLCGCTVPHYELFQMHLKGKSHQKRVKWVEGQKDTPDGMQQHWCSVCNIFCTNRESLANHLVGKKHAKTLRQRGVSNSEQGQQYEGPPLRGCTSSTSSSHTSSLLVSNQPQSIPYAAIDSHNQRVCCNLCHIMLYSNEEIRNHMASEEHVRNVMINPHLTLQDFLIPDNRSCNY